MIPVLVFFPISYTQGLVPVCAVADLQRPLLWVSVVGAIFVALKRRGSLSIWPFIGLSLRVNGLFAAVLGVYEFVRPPQVPVVLFHLHAAIWCGAILAILGAVHGIHHRPGKGRG
jgi:hypothetical protein